MCGIVGYVGKKNAADILTDGLSRLEYRGYDSAGIAVSNGGVIKTIKSEGRLKNLEEKIKSNDSFDGSCGIGHTRWATHGTPSDINSHPHSFKNVTIVHNGIIENYLQLKERLGKKGFEFKSDTDSEVIAALLSYYYDSNPIETISKVVKRLEGSYALGIIFSDQPEKIYALRKDSPLIIGIGGGENFIASDVPAIIHHTRDYLLLEQDEIAAISQTTAVVCDFDGEEVEKEVQTANWDVESAEKGGFPHFMLKEIHEQPDALRRCISPRIQNGELNLDIEFLNGASLKDFSSIHIVACGTAMHAGMVGKYAIEKFARIPVCVDVASEFRYKNPILSKNDLVIIISQSGETADTLAALRLAKEQGTCTLAVVNVVGSSIAREAGSVFYTWAGPEIAVASTKAYSVQVASLYMIAIELGFSHDKLTKDNVHALCKSLLSIPNAISSMLKDDRDSMRCAGLFQTAKNLFFIGRGIDYCLSLESSLKLKEISYIHSEAYAAGELKHGTISLIEDGTPVIAIATQKDLFAKTISNLKEVRSRGADVMLVCCSDFKVDSSLTELVLKIPEIDPVLSPLLTIIPLQLFAYHTAVFRGCDVDKPRNLAKSVTVE